MDLIVDKSLKTAGAVRKHPLYGKAVFLECGLHNPKKFCYDHHSMKAGRDQFSLSTAGMIHQELLQRRQLPTKVVCNHVRHFDNLVAHYLLTYRGLALNVDTFQLVAVADLIDRIGPLAARSVSQIISSILTTAQAVIPFKEWEMSDEDLKTAAMKSVESLRAMATTPRDEVQYQTVWEAPDQKFAVVKSAQFLGTTLYDQGFDAYAAYTENKDGCSLKWTLARASEYVRFDIPAAVAELNLLEAGWGGRPTIGGSPKDTGSLLTVEAVVEVLKKHYRG